VGKLISAKLDVQKISKNRLYKGEKGTYLTVTISLNDQVDPYGNNVSVWEEQTKEERDAKAQRNFLGNGKIVFDSEAGKAPAQQQNSGFGQAPAGLPIEEELPF